MVPDDIAMLLYQSGFGNEHLTLDTKCKAVQYILFNQVFKSRRDQIELCFDGRLEFPLHIRASPHQ